MNQLIIKQGIDIVEIQRVRNAITRHGNRFLARVFTPVELEDCCGSVSSLAVRFAGKEAVAKAIGTGIGVVSWRDIEISRESNGAPKLILYGNAARIAENQGLRTWSISLSHTNVLAIASVVAIG